LLVHRVIKAILQHGRYQLPVLPTPGEAVAKLGQRLAKSRAKSLVGKVASPDQKPKKLTADQIAWEAAGLHCSANERRADEASRDVEAWLKCKYMRDHLGEEFGGVVTAATSFGIFVQLDAMYVEGLVHITELGGEYFRFDEARQELRGERTGIRYAIGSRVRVQVSRVDLDGRKIDFRLVNDRLASDDLQQRAARDKFGDKAGDLAGDLAGADASPAGAPRKARKSSGRSGGGREGASGAGAARLSPIQALKVAVKKAASQSRKKARR
jgi:ribonuclease R